MGLGPFETRSGPFVEMFCRYVALNRYKLFIRPYHIRCTNYALHVQIVCLNGTHTLQPNTIILNQGSLHYMCVNIINYVTPNYKIFSY